MSYAMLEVVSSRIANLVPITFDDKIRDNILGDSLPPGQATQFDSYDRRSSIIF
jgi:hypothetical protein